MAKNIKPPPKSQMSYLPFQELTQRPFEELCRELCRRQFPRFEEYKLKEVGGNSQYGIDVQCLNQDGKPEVVLSAKCYNHTNVTPGKVKEWTEDFTKHLNGHWKDAPIRTFVLAVSNNGQKDSIVKAVQTEKKRFAELNLKLVAWFTPTLHDFCIQDERLVSRYFSISWLAEIFPQRFSLYLHDHSEHAAVQNFGGEGKILSANEIACIKAQANASVEKLLDLHIEMRRQGNSDDLKIYLLDLKSDITHWQSLDAATRARALRQLSLLAIDEQNLLQAEQYLNEAENEAPLPDQVLTALIAYYSDGAAKAINYLKDSHKATEIELKAALLLEQDQLDEAAQLLTGAGDTAEVFRLRAILAFKKNDLDKMLVCADKARALAPQQFGVELVSIYARLALAMIPGAYVTFAVPNPFNPALVQQTDEAQKHISDALAVAEGLIARLSGQRKCDAESWRLALLICREDSHQQALDYAAELISVSKPDPLHIAWAHMLGVQFPVGQVRKKIRDTIIADEGTSTHLATLALLNTGSPEQAVNLIEKYKHKYPNHEDFLDECQAKLSDPIRQSRVAAAQGDNVAAKVLIEALSITSGESIDPEALIATAEILLDGSHWTELNSLRSKLTQFASPRFHHLAAIGAYHCYQFGDCAEIIEASSSLFPSNDLPPYMAALRVDALERDGRTADALRMLAAEDSKKPDAAQKRRLIDGFMRTAQPENAARYARELAELPDASTQDLLRAAVVNVRVDPTFSKQVIERALERDDLDPGVVPHIMQIESRVGALNEDVKKARFYDLFQEFFASESVIRFDTVEDVLSHIDLMAVEKREHRMKWLAGGMSSHAAFAADHKSFVSLMLADHHGFYSETDDRYPPLISTAGLPGEHQLETAVDKNELALDISALLFAHRFGILEEVEAAFAIRVPNVTQQFLTQVIDGWPIQIDNETCLKIRSLQRDGWPSLSLQPVQTAEMQITQRYYAEGQFPDSLAAALDPLFSQGIGSRQQQDSLLNNLYLKQWPPVSTQTSPPESLVVSGDLLFALIASDCLMAVAKIVEIVITQSSIEELLRAVSTSEQSIKHLEELKVLQRHITRRLVDGKWRLLPTPPRAGMGDDELEEYPQHDALLASFWETLNYAIQESKPLAWIEDRFLARYNLPQILSWCHTVRILADRETISISRAKEIRDEVAASGVGFRSLNLPLIVNDLMAAAAMSNGFIETHALKQHRLAFARQSVLVQYVDWSENRRNEGGFPIGEPRYAKDLGFIVVRLLAAIWFNLDLTVSWVRDASEWLWQYMRVDWIRPSNGNDFDDGHVLKMASMLLLDAASQPFFDALKKKRAGAKRYQDYIDWLFNKHLLPRFEIDPELEKAFIKSVCSLFSVQWKKEFEGTQEEQEAGRLLFKKEFAALIELYPVNIRHAILSSPEIRELFGAQSQYAIQTSFGSLSTSAISSAIEKSLESGKPCAIEIETNGGTETNAELSLITDGEFTVTIKHMDEVLALRGQTALLSHPDALARVKLVETLAENDHHGPEWLTEAIEIVAAKEDIATRLERWQTLTENSFLDQLVEAEEMLFNQQTFKRTVFNLPSPKALFRYASLNEAADNPESCISEAIGVLTDRFGPAIARERLGFIAILGRMSKVLPNLGGNVENHPLFILLAGSNQANSVEEIVQETREVLDSYFEIFSTLVRDAAHQMLKVPDYAGLPDWQKIILAWVWADAFTRMLTKRGVESKAFTETFDNFRNYGVDQLLQMNGVAPQYVQAALEIRPIWCRARLFADLIKQVDGDVSVESHPAMLNLIGVLNEKGFIPDALLVFPEVSDSWPLTGTSVIADLTSAEILKLSDGFKNAGTLKIVDEILDRSSDDQNAEPLLALFSLAAPHSIPSNDQARILDRIERIALNEDVKALEPAMQICVRLHAELCGQREDLQRFSSFLEMLIRRRYNGNPPPVTRINVVDGSKDERFYETVIDAIFTYAKASPLTIDEKLEQMSAALVELNRLWKSAGLATHAIITNISERLPIANARSLRRLLETMRVDLD